MARKKARASEETVKVDLDWTYGKNGRLYGPGEGIEVPLSVARSLGKVPATEAASERAVLEVTESQPPAVGDLPDDFPGRAHLLDAGLGTIEAVRRHEDLTQISGIGPATADKIKEALEG
jgi:hypothetical protein